MKIFETSKSDGNRAVKLFGITIYKKTTDFNIERNCVKTIRYQSFLGGIIKTCKINDEFGYYYNKQFSILGCTILKNINDGNSVTWYLFNNIIKQLSLKERFKKLYFKYIDEKYDDIYILNANSGEIYLFLTYLVDAFIIKKSSKNPLLIATKKYHLEMIKMLCPEIPAIYLNNFNAEIKFSTFDIDKFKFYMIFNNGYFKQVEFAIKNNTINTYHYFTYMCEELKMKENEINFRNPVLSYENEASMLKKIENLKLNLDNFVFIAPEAQSCMLLDNSFWVSLIKSFKEKGYDVFVNLVDNSVDLTGAEYKSCFLTYSEVFALAQKSKKIISLRSGLTEFLVQTNIPVDVLYTKFRNRHFYDDMSVEQVMSGFSIRKLYNVNPKLINEYNFQNYARQDLINEITKNMWGNNIAV